MRAFSQRLVVHPTFERAVSLKRLLNPAPADLGAQAGADLEYDLLPN